MRPTLEHALFAGAAVVWLCVVVLPLPMLVYLWQDDIWTAPAWAWWGSVILWCGGGGIWRE